MAGKINFEKLSEDFESSTQQVESKFLPIEQVGGKEPYDQKWPSREAITESQFTIRAPIKNIERFKKLCKADKYTKYTYASMLEKLMDEYEDHN